MPVAAGRLVNSRPYVLWKEVYPLKADDFLR